MALPSFISNFVPNAEETSPRPYSLSALVRYVRELFLPRTLLTPSLLFDATPAQRTDRTSELEENQKLYVYKSPPTIPGIAFVEGPAQKLPGQMPRRRWFFYLGLASLRVILNFARYRPVLILRAVRTLIDSIFVDRCHEQSMQSTIETLSSRVDPDTFTQAVMRRFRDARVGSNFEEKDSVLGPYRDMWSLLPFPALGNVFLEDKVFARLRVGGFNPLSLFRVSSVPEMPFQITNANIPWAGDSLDACIAENRLYAQDFSFMSALPQEANSDKIFAVTSAIFAIPPGGGDLEPVAIQVNGDVFFPPKPDAPFTTHWAIAKMALNQNDATHHELFAHLGRTHLLVEPFILATMRQLPSSHPVHVLLKPHFEGTIFINDTASKNLVTPGGEVDKIFAGDITEIMKWCAQLVISNNFNASMPDVELQKRGLLDPILNMPYRDDALEHFSAMNDFVFSYLTYFYKTDVMVVEDQELQAWVQELVDPDHGRLKGFGEDGNGSVTSVRYLARAITFVIFSASVQHAAVNFPQFAYMAYAPAVSGGLYAVPPRPFEQAGMAEWAAILTPIKAAIAQIRILALIGVVYHTRLGHYRQGEMPGYKPVQRALKKYQEELRRIDSKIKARERNCKLKYDFLLSKNIPQSINI